MAEPFFLDPDYEHRLPGPLHLKFSTMGAGGRYSCCCMVPLTLFALLLAAVMAFGLVSLARELPQEIRIRYLDGKDTQVTALGCDPKNDAITYTYTIAGRRYERTHWVNLHSFSCKSVPSGRLLAAKYLPGDPSQILLTDSAVSRQGWELVILYGLFFVAAALFILMATALVTSLPAMARAPSRYQRLVDHGLLLDGEIVRARHQIVISRSSTYAIRVVYRFTTPQGRVLKGSQWRDREDLRGRAFPPAGTPVRILYADDHAYRML